MKIIQTWGIFIFENANCYRKQSALKIYNRHKPAENYCNKLMVDWIPSETNPRGFVVRPITDYIKED